MVLAAKPQPLDRLQCRGHIFSHVQPFYERAVSDLDPQRSMHRPFQVALSSFIEGSHTTKNTASGYCHYNCNTFVVQTRGLSHKHQNRLERPTRDNSQFTGVKGFIQLGPEQTSQNWTINFFKVIIYSCSKISWPILKTLLGYKRKETHHFGILEAGNTKRGSITVPLTSCLIGLESVVWQLTIFVFIGKTDFSKSVKQEVNGTVILPP